MNLKKYIVGFILLLTTLRLIAQSEVGLLPLGAPVLVNPAFAGAEKSGSFQSGNLLYQAEADTITNLFYAVYESYSDGLKGGYMLSFQHGTIGSNNLGTTEIGLAFSGFAVKTRNSNFRFAFGTNFLMANKQWGVWALDGILLESDDNISSPGKDYLRYFRIKPNVAFLVQSGTTQMGAALFYPIQFDVAGDLLEEEQLAPTSIRLHASTTRKGYWKGLHSRPYELSPSVLAVLNDERSFVRLGLENNLVNRIVGFYVQHDFTHSRTIPGFTFALKHNKLTFRLDAGSNLTGYLCQFSLKLNIDKRTDSKIYPWAPSQN